MAEIHAETHIEQGTDELLKLDPETLDPNLYYRWARNSPSRLARLQAKGFRLVSRSKDKVVTLYDQFGAPNEKGKKDSTASDHIIAGDVILVCKPKEDYERRVAARMARQRKRLQSAEENFKRRATEASRGMDKPVEVVGLDKADKEEMT